MIPAKVKKLLDSGKIKYELIKHKTVYTAYDKAATLHLSEKMVGKTLVVKLDKDIALVTIPANKNLDKNKLKKAAKSKKLDFVSEKVMKNKFKGVKMGAVPPFGRLFKILTFVDRGLMENPKIILNSGDNNWSIKISPAQYKKLIPDIILGNFSKKR